MTNFNIAAVALGFVALVSIVSGFIGGRRASRDNYAGPVQDFLLANRGLEPRSVVQLLLSSSFSLNGMLYQIWLGYAIGIWALVIQGVWAAGYWWLANYVTPMRATTGLHAFLESRFGPITRLLAALCSVSGFAVMVGWEFSVGHSTFEGLLLNEPGEMLTYFMFATVLVGVLYTVMGGLGGDAFADTIQNTIKVCIFGLMGFLLYLAARSSGNLGMFWDRMTPTWASLVAMFGTLGIFGFITNIAFSAVWQFVDMSTWQNVIASKSAVADEKAVRALKQSGVAVFIAPGIVGTVIGALLAGTSGVTSDNVMTKVMELLPTGSPLLVFAVFVAMIATILSFVDGALLAAAYSLVCDMLFRRYSLAEIDSNERLSAIILALLRITLFIVAIAGGLGVYYLTQHGYPLFEITYILVIGQLALVGPIFVALRGNRSGSDWMSLAIVAGLIVGFGCLGADKVFPGHAVFLTGAGFFASVISYLVASVVRTRVIVQ